MYNLHRDADVERLTISKFEAWLGIYLYIHTFRLTEIERYWGPEKYAGLPTPDFNGVMSYKDWIEIRENLSYDLEDMLKDDMYLFNESVVSRLLNNHGWRKEKLVSAKKRRSSLRDSEVLSDLSS